MLLDQLRQYEVRMRTEGRQPALEGGDSTSGEMPFMFAMQPVRWEVRLRQDGSVRDVQPLSSGKAKGKDLGRLTAAPNLVRAAGVKAKLLMDNAEYALGFVRKEGDPKVKQRHDAFKTLVQLALDVTEEPSVQAVAAFLRTHDSATFKETYLADFPDFAPDTNVMFSVDDAYPLERPSVQAFWARQFGPGDEAEGRGSAFVAECLITGEVGPVITREPVKIKGILGGQTSGMNFISANAQAFESYGLQASQIAPVRLEIAEQYANGLNRLLADPNTSLKVGGITYAFWTREGAVPLIARTLAQPAEVLTGKWGAQVQREKKSRPEEVRSLLWSIFQGQQPSLKAGAAFYAVGLTPSGSRIAVRTHLSSTVQEAVNRLADFFAAQTLAPIREEDEGKTYGIYQLVQAMYRDASKEHVGGDVSALVAHALSGTPLPQTFLVRLAGRNRADHEYRITRPRATLIKMVLLSRKEYGMQDDHLEILNETRPEAAYHLGRLLAVLDDVQSSVMKANTTLVDRFYGSMSTTPYAVVGRLIQSSQAHLQKLRKDNEGAYFAKQRELEAVMGRLQDIPAKPLTTPQQALFALGYYHQRAAISSGIRERVAAKKARTDSPTDTDSTEGASA